jgi:17beta-estradiol 17-dehydrogenase/3alpha(17beta)-hydroxysteroid dehydrogenase (NAD+)
MSQLAGKLALITGAGSGIGLSSARLFARNGADLVLVDRSKDVVKLADEIKQENGSKINVTSHLLDVTVKKNVQDLFGQIKELHSNHQVPNILLNSAGIARIKSFTDVTEEEYDEMININLKGTFLITQEYVKHLLENFPKKIFENETESYASIINLSSQAGKHGAAFASHYAISKAGIIGLSKSLARELGYYRIRCNSVLPFFIETPMVAPMDAKSEKIFKKQIPVRRFGKPEEVAELCLFLGSNISSYVNGASIDIAGGF